MLSIDELKEIEFGLIRTLQGGRIEYCDNTRIRWEPYEHGVVGLYNGTVWVPVSPPDYVYFNTTDYTIHGASISGNTNYDVYARYQNESTFKVEIVPWTSNTVRQKEPDRFEGVLVYNSATASGKQMRYMGSIRTTSGTAYFADSDTQRFVVNWNNPVTKSVITYNGLTVDWNSTASWQEFRAGFSQVRGEFLSLYSTLSLPAMVQAYLTVNGHYAVIGLGLNNTVTYTGKIGYYYTHGNSFSAAYTLTYGVPVIGYNYITLVGKYIISSAGTFSGDSTLTRGQMSIYT
jgi:hypothetical protein